MSQLHSRELERWLQLGGFEFFTNARVAQRGGGVAIVVNTNQGYFAKRLQVNCSSGPNSLEIVWVLVSPPPPQWGTSSILSVHHYIVPPRSKLNDKMIEHL